MNIVELYKKAIEMYNAGDIEGMSETWDEKITITNVTDGSIVATNKEQALSVFKKQYKYQPTQIFVENTQVMGNKLVVFEREFDKFEHETDAICILESDHDLIKNVWWVF